MPGSFFDTNVILYLLEDSWKADRAEAVLAAGGTVSVQVLNEALANCRRKAGMNWQEAQEFLSGVRSIVEVTNLTPETHDIGLALCARYDFSVYDAMIVASALLSGSDVLVSEDMHHGLIVEDQLRIFNPFSQGPA